MGGGTSKSKNEYLAPLEFPVGAARTLIPRSKPSFRTSLLHSLPPLEYKPRSTSQKLSELVHSHKQFNELEAIQKKDPNLLLSSKKYSFLSLTREDGRAQHGTADNSVVLLDRYDKTQLFSRLKLNCSFLIFEYSVENLLVCLSVCKSWNNDLKALLKNRSGRLASQFSNKYYQHLHLTSSQISITRPLELTGWYRVDFQIRCRPSRSLQGLNIVLCHQYRLTHRQERLHFNSHCFDCLNKDEDRSVWIHREENRIPGISKLNRVMPVLQIRPTDQLVINVNLWSGEGLLDLKSFDWLPIGLYQRSLLYKGPDRLIDKEFDETRSSEIELFAKWRRGHDDPARKLLPENYLLPNFVRVSTASSGLDPVYLKGIFKAVKEGNPYLPGNLTISETDDPLKPRSNSVLKLTVHEQGIVQTISRAGYLQEGNSLSVKFGLGDYLIFYVMII